MNVIQDKLFELQDLKYRKFHKALVPNIASDNFIGVRVPDIRKLAKDWMKRTQDDKAGREQLEKFLGELPHQYYEENQLHSFFIANLKESFDYILARTEKFLPYIDNWGVCDSFKPSGLKKDTAKLYENLKKYMESDRAYTVRWSVVIQISWFLEQEFRPDMLEKICQVAKTWSQNMDDKPEPESEEYYVLMAVAWYFSVALVKQYQSTIPYFTEQCLPRWVHNKSLQKAVESKRFTAEEKNQFRRLKIKR